MEKSVSILNGIRFNITTKKCAQKGAFTNASCFFIKFAFVFFLNKFHPELDTLMFLLSVPVRLFISKIMVLGTLIRIWYCW